VTQNKALTTLQCASNQITDLDVTKNTQLTKLDFGYNKIGYIEVSKNTALKSLTCTSNQIYYLDITKNLALTELSSGNNLFTTIDLSKNTALTSLICNTNKLAYLDVSKNLALTRLLIYRNDLQGIDISFNTNLEIFDCSYNVITALDVSKNLKLDYLYCDNNKLKNLDVSKNTKLSLLDCSNNLLTTLDVAVNSNLHSFECASNKLTSLNLKNGNNTLLEPYNPDPNFILYNVDFRNNPNLTCIQVDDAAYSNSHWSTQKDAAATFNTNCGGDFVLIADHNFEQRLIDLGIDTDGLNGKITVADITSVTSLDLSNSNISNLSGMENFKSLVYLDCSYNQLTTIDISKNVALETLDISSNQITTLDLSKNINIKVIYISNNPLISINLRNGNNRNLAIASITDKKAANTGGTSFLGLTTLSCIMVDDPAYSNANWSKIKEPTASYSATCSTLGLDDSAFNKVVLYPNPTKGEVSISNISLEKATVYNSVGQLVKSFTFSSVDTNNTINLSDLPKGVYYVYLINKDAASAKKVIVE
ncbi:MAG: T9SS type A sorting domain-containing protein, partial [Flavobacterium sp.]